MPYDIKLEANTSFEADIVVTDTGDLEITDSVCQNILIRLRWFYEEWRLGPALGFPWFEYVFDKNPNLEYIKMLIENEIRQVNEVTDAHVIDLRYDPKKRELYIKYEAVTSRETYEKELKLYG